MDLQIRLRGIYSTALTRIFTQKGYSIVDPSQKIKERFKLNNPSRDFSLPFVKIETRKDQQGVKLEGPMDKLQEVIMCLRSRLYDCIVRWCEKGWAEVEFPGLSKAMLDRIRAEVTPTIKHHHRIKTFAAEVVDKIENDLPFVGVLDDTAGETLNKTLLGGYQTQKEIQIIHIRPEGRIVYLGKGRVVGFDSKDNTLYIKRIFRSPGRYDGLGIKKDLGDYSITMAKEGEWWTSHSYFSSGGRLKGRFININTPVEFYPREIRYVDLHIDVVCLEDGRRQIVDEEALEQAKEKGYITARLKDKATRLAKEIMKT
jgi:hypothetical protein